MRRRSLHSMGWAAACFAALLGFDLHAYACGAPEPKAQVRPLGGIPVMIVDRATDRARTWLTLRNDGEAEAPLLISLGSFVSRATGRHLATEATFFQGNETTGVAFVDSRIQQGENVRIKIEVANLWEAGESTAELSINGLSHTLSALHYDVPFNVGVQSSTPDRPSLSLERDRGGLMILKNEDPKTYAVTWRLTIPNDAAVLTGETMLPPESSQPVIIQPPGAWFRNWFDGLFKDADRSAHLNLTFAPGAASMGMATGPVKTLPLQLHLSYWPHTTKAWVGGLIVFGVLVLGGVCSLFLSLWIPNKLALIELVGRLNELAQKTRFISRNTDSALRVGVRVERLRLWEMLRALSILNADAAEKFKQFEKEIGVLATRVELVESLDEVAQKLEALRVKTSDAPPTLLMRAVRSLDEATRLLKLTGPTEADFQTAQAAIRAADSRLDKIVEADPQFAGILAGHVKTLREEYDESKGVIGRRKRCKELRPRLTDLFEILKDGTYEDPDAITPSRYHWIDVSIEKLFVLRHYILRCDDTQADPERHERVVHCEPGLVEYLRLQSPYTLDLARRLREEIEQDVFSSHVIEQLHSGNITIRSEPLTAHANTPVRLWVEFSDPRFRHCAALRNFRCVWEFAEAVGQEQGWEIFHYFRNEREAEFHVRFMTSDGKPVGREGSASLQLKTRIPFRSRSEERFSDRWKIETGRLLLALLIALLGLIGGAREQLLKLDVIPGLVAVFLLGFGADTVKNLFTRRA